MQLCCRFMYSICGEQVTTSIKARKWQGRRYCSLALQASCAVGTFDLPYEAHELLLCSRALRSVTKLCNSPCDLPAPAFASPGLCSHRHLPVDVPRPSVPQETATSKVGMKEQGTSSLHMSTCACTCSWQQESQCLLLSILCVLPSAHQQVPQCPSPHTEALAQCPAQGTIARTVTVHRQTQTDIKRCHPHAFPMHFLSTHQLGRHLLYCSFLLYCSRASCLAPSTAIASLPLASCLSPSSCLGLPSPAAPPFVTCVLFPFTRHVISLHPNQLLPFLAATPSIPNSFLLKCHCLPVMIP